MSARIHCPSCQSPLPPHATAGLCAACLFLTLTAGDAADESAPARLGEYDLLEPLGHGGMGTVWRARQRSAKRDVALKTIIARGADAERRFRAEIEAAARLEHPNIVPVYEVGEADGQLWFTMRLLAGGTLAGKTMQPCEAAALVVKLARAIASAHERGVLHRDLKPANVLLDESGEPFIADFGLARLLDAGASLSVSGAVVGTPQYMAPEQASGGHATTATDVYGLGAILYELLSGRAPFAGKSTVEVLRRVVEDEPVPLSDDSDIGIIALKCLSKTPARRYASAAALADDLGRWLRGEPIHARPATVAERLRAWSRRNRALAASLAVAAVAVGAFIFLQWRHSLALGSERDTVRGERDAAQSARTRAERSEASLAENLYAADMQLAWQAYSVRDLGDARRRLERARAAFTPGVESAILERLCDGSQERVLGGLPGPATALAWVEKNARLFASGGDWLGSLPVFREDGKFEPWRGGAVEFWGESAARTAVARLLPVPWPAEFGAVPETPGQWLFLTNPANPANARQLAVSADGRRFALAHRSRWTRVWESAPAKLLGVAPGIAGSVAMSADGRIVAIGAAVSPRNAGALVADLEAPGSAWLPPEAGGNVALSTDGDTLLTGAWDGRLRVWLVKEQRRIAEVALGDWACALALSADAKFGAAARAERRSVLLFTPDSGVVVRELTGHSGRIHALAFSPDGRWLASGGADQTVRLWSTGGEGGDIELRGHTAEVLSLAFSGDGSRVFSASADGSVRQWQTAPTRQQNELPVADGDAFRHQFLVSPDGRFVASPQWTGDVWFTDVASGAVRQIRGARGSVEGWLRDGTLVVAACDSADGPVTIEWRPQNGPAQRRTALADSSGAHSARRLSPDGSLLAGATRDGRVRVWQLADGSVAREWTMGKSFASALAWSPDGTALATVVYGGPVTVFRVADGATLFALGDGSGRWAEFSPDGSRLALADWRPNEITLHDARTGALAGTFAGHMDHVWQVVFSPDGRTLASTSHDRTARLWHVHTLRPLAVLPQEHAGAMAAFSPDGSFLLTAGRSHRAMFWRAK